MKTIRTQALEAEHHATLTPGEDERFSGYGVMGLPFSSGYVLAMRRFPVTSVGPGYTSVWLRRPSGSWTIYADAAPEVSCARYFSAALNEAVQCDVRVDWTGDTSFTVSIGRDVDLTWTVELESTPVTAAMSAVMTALPNKILSNKALLKTMGSAAGPMLSAGRLGLTGSVPNKQGFRAKPRRIWFISRSTVTLGGEDLGRPQPLPVQSRLGDFWIPQRGIFVIGASSFDRFDPAEHLPATARRTP
ncbi:hypothetical protein QF031_003083 [Pseudarthrobacter defluvii]|uniref:hypothetical protein n=1 Tax=Pseudarthrobacter defluvii TaxID=410837 RepID=UPI0027811B02|nr:hypothetical protein [Pseudarthrobacter defluvii]MDQ0770334.1 hypothetical protein [Pseudarthrobacter defluvii]